MDGLLRGIVILLFWVVLGALLLAAVNADARDVLEDYIPFFDVADPVIDWLSDFLSDLWDALIG